MMSLILTYLLNVYTSFKLDKNYDISHASSYSYKWRSKLMTRDIANLTKPIPPTDKTKSHTY